MATYSTHKSTPEGKAQTLARKSVRASKRTGMYNPIPASAHVALKGA
jgi:hypothetical protein